MDITDNSLVTIKKSRGEMYIKLFIYLCASLSIATTVGIVFILSRESLLFFRNPDAGLREFFLSTVWQPQTGSFGILPLVTSTLLTSFIAMLSATPLAIMVAVYLSEYASSTFRKFFKPTLEILAGIPTVVYGYFAINQVTPFLQNIFGVEKVELYNTASAGITIGILICPIITTMVDDALNAIPLTLREASYGLGATKFETSIGIVLPAAFSGIAAAFILGFSRAIGETMIVALAAGAGSKFTLNPLKGAETMTGYIVRISGGDIGYNTLDYNSIFAIGLMLFLITFVLNVISRKIVEKAGKWNNE